MSPKYKLIYFPLEGRAEPIRWLFSLGNIPFEDVRISFEEWGKVKPTMPFGKLPILEVDGKQIIESRAICRYVAKQVNLAGKNDWDAVQIDGIVDAFQDYIGDVYGVIMEKDEATRDKKLENLQKTISPFYLSKFDKIVKENNGYLVNGQLSWADVYIVSIGESTKYVDVSNYPNLKALFDKIMSIPQIKDWIAKRPSN